MKPVKKFVSVLLIVMLAASVFTACSSGNNNGKTNEGSNGNQAETDKEAQERPEITLNVFSMLTSFSGEQEGWFAKVIKDKFNIKLNITNTGGSDAKLLSMMASGDLGDLITFGNTDSNYTNAIEAGLLLDWNKDGLLDKYGPDIKKNAQMALDKNRVSFGGGTSIYGIGGEVGPESEGPSESKDLNFHPELRWDLYEKLGRPQIKTMEDYLPVLKKMQELEPKTESGKPTYAFSLWSDWDGSAMMNASSWSGMYGFGDSDGIHAPGYTQISADKNEVQGLLDENGTYLRALKFYYDANQMGLVDPDSMTQNVDSMFTKMTDGQVHFALFSWMTDVYNTPERLAEGKGFALVPFEEERSYSWGFNPYGSSRVFAIGSNTKHPERIMEMLNWLYTPEGFMVSSYGPEGLMWEMKDGKQVLTELGVKTFPSNEVNIPEEFGGSDWNTGGPKFGIAPYKSTMINPITGEPYEYALWSSTLEKAPNKLEQDWSAAMGAKTAVEWFVKNDKIAVNKPIFTGKPIEEMPDDLKQKMSQVGSVIKQYSWKMVFAKNEDQFNQLKKEMIDKANGLGYDEVVAFNKKQNEEAFTYRK